jgi:hypothetical protein
MFGARGGAFDAVRFVNFNVLPGQPLVCDRFRQIRYAGPAFSRTSECSRRPGFRDNCADCRILA